jgi:hypothetical protein
MALLLSANCCRHWWNAVHLLYQLFCRQQELDKQPGRQPIKGYKVEAVSLSLKKGKVASAPDGDADLSEVWQVRQ